MSKINPGDVTGVARSIETDAEIEFPYSGVRDFIDTLDEVGEFQTLESPIDYDGEYAGVVRWLGEINGPAVMFENVEGLNTPHARVLSGMIWGTFARCALGVGETDYKDAIEKIRAASEDKSKWREPKTVSGSRAPCKENVIRDVDIREQIPRLIMQEMERSSYFTLDNTITKDPETGERNVGDYWHGMTDVDPRTGDPYPEEDQREIMGSYIVPGANQGGIHYEKHQEMHPGEPMDVAIAAGLDPVLEFSAGYPMSYEYDEYEYASALRGEPVELVDCETVDLKVPATAEWVVEGQLLPGFPDENVRYDGPPSSFHGYVPRSPEWVMKTRVTCITHRDDPIWPQAVELAMPPIPDHLGLACMSTNAKIQEIRDWMPFITEIDVLPWQFGTHNGIVVVSISQKRRPHYARRIMEAIWSHEPRVKYIVVVDDDYDVTDWGDVTAALAQCVQPKRDVYLEEHTATHFRDGSIKGFPSEINSRDVVGEGMGIDATTKAAEYFEEGADPRARKADPSRETLEAVYEKLKDELDFSPVDVEAYLDDHEYKTRHVEFETKYLDEMTDD